MSLLDVLSQNHSKQRQEALKSLEFSLAEVFGEDSRVLVVSTNVLNPMASSQGASLNPTMIPLIEEHLTKLQEDGGKKLFILLSTFGGVATFPEMLLSKIRYAGFNKVYTVIMDIAFSAGSLLALLSDKIIGFPDSLLGPVDPQMIVQTHMGPRIISAISYKNFIEKTLPTLVNDKKLGKENLARLYSAQDLYLYEEALKSIKYVEALLEKRFGDSEETYSKIRSNFLVDVTLHSKPIALIELKEILNESSHDKVFVLDQSDENKEIFENLKRYIGLHKYAYMFEKHDHSIRLSIIASKFGEAIAEAVPQLFPQVPSPGSVAPMNLHDAKNPPKDQDRDKLMRD